MTLKIKPRALISVTDKEHVIEFAKELVNLGFEIVSTGGTAKALTEAGVRCTLVETVTGFPEMLDGRLKTLHPKIFGGIIADQNEPAHMQTIADHEIEAFGIVVVNLYTFATDKSIANIDVGGPAMIRAAAKNYNSVLVVTERGDYSLVLKELIAYGEPREHTRFEFAVKAFRMTAEYDRMIADHLEHCLFSGTRPDAGKKH